MLSKDCSSCIHCMWVVGIGLGVRCYYQENQKYKDIDDKHPELPVIISRVPTGCEYYWRKSNGN